MNTLRISISMSSLVLALVCCGCIGASPGKKTHYQWGLEHFDAGDYQEAAHEFDLAYQENAKELDALFNLGLSNLQLGDYSGAIGAYQEYLQEKPDEAEAHINLAFAFAGLKDATKATQHFEQAIALDKTYSYPYCSYANYHLQKNTTHSNRKAKALLDTAINVGRQDSTAFYLHGLVEERLNNPQGARSDFDRAVQLDPNNQPALVKLADYEVEEEDYTSAAKRYIHAAVLDETDAVAFLGAGQCYRELGNLSLSLQSLWKAKSINADDPAIDKALALTSLALVNQQVQDLLDTHIQSGFSEEEHRSIQEELQRLQELQMKWRKLFGR